MEKAVAGVKCSSCHQDHNLSGLHMPPPGMQMIWERLTDRQLCELFKDPSQSGGRNVYPIVQHMDTPVVRWGWNPGAGRTPITTPHREFLARIREWASNGAACPDH